MKYPQNRYFLYAVISALVIFICLRECGAQKAPSNPEPTDNLKTAVKALKHSKDSVHEKVIYRDSVRTKTVIRWRTVRHDSIIPCEEKLVICDTLVLADSSLISELKIQARVDSMIIQNLDKVVQMDSVQIAGLNKEVRKQKRLKWIFLGVGAATNLLR